MRLRVSLDSWRWWLISGLGCGALSACGGEATHSGTTDGDAASSGNEASVSGNTQTATSSGSSGGASSSGSSTTGSSAVGSGGNTTSADTSSTGAGGNSSVTAGSITGAGGGLSGAGGASTTGTLPTKNCDNPVDFGGNWEQCEDGTLHRTEPGTCPNLLPTTPPEPTGVDSCTSDADCTAAPFGYCATVPSFEGTPGNYCHYGCETDADCDAGLVCMCGDPIGSCQSAGCSSDQDCSDGFRCADYVSLPGCGGLNFACETAEDGCITDADCEVGFACGHDGMRHACMPMNCVIGRPFLVRGEERVACLVADGSWCPLGPAEHAPLDQALSRDEATAIAQRWTETALMEHASIAAFARFTLQLLSLGAPPELIHSAERAMGDETRHAQICFGLAARYGGRAAGPGPLKLDHALEHMDTRSIVLTAVLEGCVGETLAAIEAAEAAERSSDPGLRDVLRTIAADEQRHAELAWQFVAWALRERDPSLSAEVDALFASVVAGASQVAARAPCNLELVLERHGHLPEAHRLELRRQALERVVAPAAAVLRASVRRTSEPEVAERAPAAAVSPSA